MRTIVFGDVGGHYASFEKALRSEGIDVERFSIPKDLTVIQVGDLVHRGPHSDQVVNLVDNLMLCNPGQWFQLFGNHEAMHLDDAMLFFKCNCSPFTIETIRRWWHERQAHVALAMSHDTTKRLLAPTTLFTHAGLMYSWWRRANKDNAEWTAQYINSFQPAEVAALDQPGEMMGIGHRNNAGPWWAQCTNEVYTSWEHRDEVVMPFNQIHGHSTPWFWEANRWSGSTPLRYRKRMKLSIPERVCWLQNDEATATFAAIDPGYGANQTEDIMSHLTIEGVHDITPGMVY